MRSPSQQPTPRPPLDDTERLARLRLIRTEHVGPITFRQLLARFETAAAALDALPDLARRGGRRRVLKVPTPGDALREIRANQAIGADLMVFGDPDYPPSLAALDDAPVTLSVIGRGDLLSRPAAAVVGARNASVNGRSFAEHLAGRIGAAGYVVTSGLARGIDAAAHGGSVQSGTVAVLAGGADVIYPPEHDSLWREIAERGAIVAEQPPGTTPMARHFPSRNRIIAGLSLGVVVVEAATRSGSLITARQALDQGRDVFAVPGSPLDPRCAGSNGLLKEGAAFLVDSAEDVLRVLEAQPTGFSAEPTTAMPVPAITGTVGENAADDISDATRGTILSGLSPEPVAVDELIRGCQLSPASVATVLLEAELAGLVDRHPGNRVSRRGNAPD